MRGVTLVELLVVLVLLGTLTALAGVSLASLRAPPENALVRSLRDARAEAIRTGRAVVVERGGVAIRFLPDGSSSGGTIGLAGERVAVDQLTGGVRAGE